MLASELIRILQKCIDSGGDREVNYEDKEYGWLFVEGVSAGKDRIHLLDYEGDDFK